MAYIVETTYHSFPERTLASLSQAFHRSAVHLARRRVYDESYNELRTLSERELDDIGMNRAMIEDVAWQSAVDQVRD